MSHKIAIAKILSNFQLSQEGIINSIDTLINDILNDIGTQFVGSTLESKEIDLKEAILILAKHLRNDEKLFQEFEIGISSAFEENFAVYCKANARKNQFNDEQINYISRNAAKHWLYQFSKNHAIKDFPSGDISRAANSTGPEYVKRPNWLKDYKSDSVNGMALDNAVFDEGKQFVINKDKINQHKNVLDAINQGDLPSLRETLEKFGHPDNLHVTFDEARAFSLIDDTYQLLSFLDDNNHIETGAQIKLERIKKEWQSILAGEPSAIPFKFFGEKQRQKMDPTGPTPQLVKEQDEMISKQAKAIEKMHGELQKQLELITSQNQLADDQEKMIKELLEQISDLKEMNGLLREEADTKTVLVQRWDQKNKDLSVENINLWQCLDQARVIKSYILENKNGIHTSNGFSLVKLTEMLLKLEHLDKLYREQDKKEASKDENKAIDKKLTCAGEQIPPYFEFIDGYFASNTNYGTWYEARVHLPYKRLFEVREEADVCYKKLLQELLLQSEVVTDVTANFVALGYVPKTHLERPIRDGFKEGGINPTSLNVFLADNGLRIIKYTANGVDHLSLRHPDRLPSLQEIHYFRDIFYPDLGQMAYVISKNDPAVGTKGNDTITLIQLFYK